MFGDPPKSTGCASNLLPPQFECLNLSYGFKKSSWIILLMFTKIWDVLDYRKDPKKAGHSTVRITQIPSSRPKLVRTSNVQCSYVQRGEGYGRGEDFSNISQPSSRSVKAKGARNMSSLACGRKAWNPKNPSMENHSAREATPIAAAARNKCSEFAEDGASAQKDGSSSDVVSQNLSLALNTFMETKEVRFTCG